LALSGLTVLREAVIDLRLTAFALRGYRLTGVDRGRALRSNNAVRLIAAIWRLFRDLVRDLAPGASEARATSDEQAQEDDILDAAFDEDGMDATGL
jgi:hypothetical protein